MNRGAEISSAAELLELERARDERVLDLARLLSIASRIEPELVRAMRRQLMVEASADLESDLWFSALVQARGPDALVFLPDVTELLRQELGDSKRENDRAAAWEILRRCHEAHSPLLHLEEYVTYLAIAKGTGDYAKLERELGRALLAVESASDDALARWAARMLPRMPARARASDAAIALARAASERLDGARIHGFPDALSTAPRSGGLPPRIQIGLRFLSSGLEISEPPAAAATVIDVPASEAIVLEVQWPTIEGRSARYEVLQRGTVRVASVPVGPELVVATAAGAEHRLRPALPRQRPVALLTSEMNEVEKVASELGWALVQRPPLVMSDLDAVLLTESVGQHLEDGSAERWLTPLLDFRLPTILLSAQGVWPVEDRDADSAVAGSASVYTVRSTVTSYLFRFLGERQSLKKRERQAGAPFAQQLRAALLDLDLQRPKNWLAKQRRQGLGALSHEHGTAFRVWAPSAQKVTVSGSFNNWSAEATPMEAEPGGHWYVDVPEVGAGAIYRYAITSGGTPMLRNDPRARQVARSGSDIRSVVVGEQRTPSSLLQPPALNDLVLYQLHVGTFTSTKPGAGTFDDVRGLLPYLRDLGINAIQLLPVAECPGEFSAGYGASFPFAVSAGYGGPEALRRLIDSAHAQGIVVILEVVYTHLAPTENVLWQFDTATGSGIYYSGDGRDDTPWGRRPDYGHPEVQRYVRDNVFMWLDEYQADGLHWPGTAWLRGSGRRGDFPEGWALMRSINLEMDSRFPARAMIAEDSQSGDIMTKDVSQGGAGFDAQWDLSFASILRESVTLPDDNRRDIAAVAAAITGASNGLSVSKRVIYTESHDWVSSPDGGRLPNKISPTSPDDWFAFRRSTLAAAVAMTSPGIPMLFQGQEFLATAPFDPKVSLDWSAHNRIAGVRLLYRDLIRLRGTRVALRSPGVKVFHMNHGDKVLAFHRWIAGRPEDDVVVVANFGNRLYREYRIGLPQGGAWRVIFRIDRPEYGDSKSTTSADDEIEAQPSSKDGLGFNGDLRLGAYDVVVLILSAERRP
jgi:1,4-alpha-glucan branching enzyme